MTSDLFKKLAAEEEQFFKGMFLSPVLKGRPIRVRISGIVLDFCVEPKTFEGWGLFRVTGHKKARHMGEPTFAQRQEYLKLLPKMSFVVCWQDDQVLGIPASKGDTRFRVCGQAPISLPEEVRLFDTVDVRFDGENFWYEKHSNFRSPRTADQLRELFNSETELDQIEISGLTQEEKQAYAYAYELHIELNRDRKEDKLRAAVERAGGQFHGYVERGDSFTVELSVDGHQYRPVVNSETLQVVTAGICLTDHSTNRAYDTDFDLQSLVGVFREGQNRHLIYHW